MALHDEILREIVAGRVPRRFKAADLKRRSADRAGYYKVGNREFSKNAIAAIPRNHSVRIDGSDQGDYVKKGRQAAFYWYGNGEFELIVDREHRLSEAGPEDEEFDADEGAGEALIMGGPLESPRSPLPFKVDEDLVRRLAQEHESDPAAIIVDYLAERPFQAFYRRKPVGPRDLRGWGKRLAAYFWPTPEVDWSHTCAVVSGLSREVQQAVQGLREDRSDLAAQGRLLEAFKSICVWGGVKLPESDAGKLAEEVLRALRALEKGEEPPSGCRLNSAWTKLYAFALPYRCVIYDSRVAAALTSILDPAKESIGASCAWAWYSRLGTVPGRGGSRPRTLRSKWPAGYGVWKSQICANQLCQDLVATLNRRPDCRKEDGSSWTLRDVEAVLFMEGH